MTQRTEETLDAFFAAARETGSKAASDDLMARILADAGQVQADNLAVSEPRSSYDANRNAFSFRAIWDLVGGGAAVAAFACSAMLGVGVSYSGSLSSIIGTDLAATDAVYSGTVMADLQSLYVEE